MTNAKRYLTGKALISAVVAFLIFVSPLLPTISAEAADELDKDIKTNAGKFTLISDQKDFKAGASIEFRLEKRHGLSWVMERLVRRVFKNYHKEEALNVRVLNWEDKEIESFTINLKGENELELISLNKQNLPPGEYRVEITSEKTGDSIVQNFTWGVLAINTNKSIYLPQEIAKLSMAVLDQEGKMVCDAAVDLDIKAPDGRATYLSTQNQTIRVNPGCRMKRMILEPDFEAEYQVKGPGTYEMTLVAKTPNGTHTVKDHFEVRESVPFDIERTTATRIYPPEKYPATFSVKSNEDFKGVVTETVPASFWAECQISDFKCQVREEEGSKKIVWEVDWKKGETYELSYEFKTPIANPQFYLLGPLKIGNQAFTETRQWQLAIDAVITAVQSGTVSLTAATSETVTDTLSPAVDTTKSFLIFNARNNINRPIHQVRGRILNSTTVEFTQEKNVSANVNIQWYVVEYNSGVSVQRGVRAQDATTMNIGSPDFTGVSSTTQAFVTYSKTVGATHGTYGADDAIFCRLTSTTNLQCRVGVAGAGGMTIHWEVVEFTNSADIGVENGVKVGPAMDGGILSVDQTIATVGDINKTFVLAGVISVAAAGTNICDLMIRTQLIDASTIRFDRDCTGDVIDEIGWQVIELKDNSSVQRGSENFVTSDAQELVTINQVDTGRSVAFGSTLTGGGGETMGKTAYAGDDILGVCSVTMALAATQITMDRNNTVNTCDVGWFVVEFGGINLSGTVYSDEGATALGINLTVNLRIDGAGTFTDETDANGLWSISGLTVSSGDIITVYLDNEVEEGTTVFVSDATNQTDVHIYQNRVIVRHDTGTSITNANLNTGDDADDDVKYNVVTNNVTVDSGFELHVWTSDTYDPGGTITTNATGGDFHIDDSATADIDTATSTIGRDVLVDAGATINFNANTNINGGDITQTTTGVINTTAGTPTVTMSGTGTVGGGSGAITFYNLSTTGTGTTTFSGSGTNTVNNNVAVGTGTTLNINDSISITGSLTNTTTGVIGTSAGTPTVTVSGTTIGGGSGNITFYNLTKAGAGTTTFSGSGTNTVNNNLSVSAGTLTLSNPLTVTNDVSVATGVTFNINANLTVNGGDLTTAGTGVINTTSGTPTVTMSGTGNVGGGSGNITFYNLTTSGTGTTTFSGTGTNTVNNNVTVGTGTTLNINSSVSIAGNLTNTTTGVINTTSGTPTVTMTGATVTIGGGSGNITFYSLATSGTGTHTFSGTGTNTVNNNVTVGAGTTLNINDSISITGSLTNTTTGVIGTSAGTPTVTVQGTSLGGGSGAITFYNLTKSGGGTTTFSGSGTNTVNNNLSVSAGTLTLSNVLTVTNDGSVATGATFNINANLTINGGDLTTAGTGVINTTNGTPTVTISGTGTIGGGSGAITFYNLTTTGTGTTTFSGSGTNTVNNNITVGSGTTLNLNSSITVTGSLTNTTTGIIGTSAGTPTVTVQGTSLGGGSGAITFYNLTKSGGGTTTFSGSGTNTVNNNLTVSAGTLTLSNTLTVTSNVSVATGATFNVNANLNVNGGDFTNTGTGIINTTSGTPTVTISGAGSLGGGSGAITFYNLDRAGTGTTTFSGTGTNTVNNNLSVSAGTLTLSGTLTVTGDASVATGATFNVNANLNIDGGGFTTAGTSTINTTAGTPTVNITGTGNLGGGSTSVTIYNLTIDGISTTTTASNIVINNDLVAGDGTNTATMQVNTNDNSVTVTGDVTISANATYSASSNTANPLTIGTNFTNSGTFTNNGGEVVFNTSSTSVITGATTWNNLTSTIAGKTIQFQTLTVQTVNGVLTFTGSSGNNINIQSTSTGIQWDINHQGTESVSFMDLRDGGCDPSSTDITTSNSEDVSNNDSCWLFPAPAGQFDFQGVNLQGITIE